MHGKALLKMDLPPFPWLTAQHVRNEYPQQPETKIAAAAKDIPDALSDLKPDSCGDFACTADSLIETLRDVGHNRAAAAWAVYQGIQEELLRAKLTHSLSPECVRAMMGDSPNCVVPSRIPLDRYYYLKEVTIVSTDALWEWNRESLSNPIFFTPDVSPAISLGNAACPVGEVRKLIAELRAEHADFDNCVSYFSQFDLDRLWALLVSVQGIEVPDCPTLTATTFEERTFRAKELVVQAKERQAWREFHNALNLAERAIATVSVDALDSNSREVKPASGNSDKKRPNNRGHANDLLIAALTEYHQYESGSCLNTEPIKNNELARQVGVATKTASYFFKRHFDGYQKYMAQCGLPQKLAASLKALNNEYSPKDFNTARTPNEIDRERDEDY